MLQTRVPGRGATNAKIMVIGEVPGLDEQRAGEPFVGTVGKELDSLLHSVGILRTECYLTNLYKYKVPNNKIATLYAVNTKDNRVAKPVLQKAIEGLWEEIDEVSPNIILGLGDAVLWALTGETGIGKWRGSMLNITTPQGRKIKLIPTYHPSAILRVWKWKTPAGNDIRRIAEHCETSGHFELPKYEFEIEPSFTRVMSFFDWVEGESSLVPVHLSCDIETRNGHIACVGFAWSDIHAICIPFLDMRNPEGHWPEGQELIIIERMRKLFTNKNVKFSYQNGLYDLQHFFRHWLVLGGCWLDTMLAHHVLFAELPKGLDFLSSLYCAYHCYWKDEGKTWNPKTTDEKQLWVYNCKDAVATWEIAEVLDDLTSKKEEDARALEFQMEQFKAVFRMMLNGVSINLQYKAELAFSLGAAIEERQARLEKIVGRTINPRSPKQMQELFYQDLGIKPVRSRKTGRLSTDEESLKRVGNREPLCRPLIKIIEEIRSLGVFLSTFVKMRLDVDNKARCSYNIAGTVTFRYSSSKNAFESGGNLQNIPATADEDSLYPNIRKMFIPDLGHIIWDIDLDRADAQVVAWEANDDDLKQKFREGADVHLENAKDIFGNPRLTEHSHERKLAKAGVHATNYGVTPRTLAAALGITVKQAEHFIRRWFSVHPGIVDWHRRVEDQLLTTRTVSNRFGFHRRFFDRISGVLPEALAWIPQSTVALVIDKGLVNVTNLPHSDCLMQVHDSVVGQTRKDLFFRALPEIQQAMLIEIPYEDPLTISVGIKASDSSWGECKEIPWDARKL